MTTRRPFKSVGATALYTEMRACSVTVRFMPASAAALGWNGNRTGESTAAILTKLIRIHFTN
jgi:hypothetical protein